MRNEPAGWIPAALICAATLIAYSNSFPAGFVLDSQSRILEDPRITAATAENVQLILVKDYWYPQSGGGIYRPLTTLSYLFNYAVMGGRRNPLGYHVVNLLLHWLNIVLLYEVGRRILGGGAAAVAAAVWALHPVATEAVTNIVGRADLIATAAVLGALLCHLQDRSRPLALASIAAAGIFAKESAVMIPAVMALYDFTFARRPRVWNYAAVAAALLLFWWARTEVFARLPAVQFPYVMNPLIGAGFVESRLTAIKVIGRYLLLLVWPASLSCDYSYNQIPLAGWRDWQALLALAACLGVLAAAARRRTTLFFALFFFATLLPVSNLILPIGTIMAERFLYLPSIAFAACVAFQRHVRIAAAVLAVLLGTRTYLRNQEWQSNQTLFASAVQAAPQSFKTHWSMAYLLEKDNLDAAVREADRAVAILDHLPDERNAAPAYDLAGELYRKKGDESHDPTWYRASLDALEHGVRIDRADQERKRKLEAERGTRAVPLDHLGWQPLYRNLGITLLRLGETRRAVEALQVARALNPSDAAVYVHLASAHDAEARVEMLLEGLTLAPGDPALMDELGRAYPALEQERCAIGASSDLLRLNRECPKLHGHLCAAQRSLVRWLAENRYTKESEQAKRQARNQLGCE